MHGAERLRQQLVQHHSKCKLQQDPVFGFVLRASQHIQPAELIFDPESPLIVVRKLATLHEKYGGQTTIRRLYRDAAATIGVAKDCFAYLHAYLSAEPIVRQRVLSEFCSFADVLGAEWKTMADKPPLLLEAEKVGSGQCLDHMLLTFCS